WTGDLRSASRLPGKPDLGRYLLLTRLRGVQATGDQKQVLDGCFARPGPEYPGRLPSIRFATCEGMENLAPSIPRRSAVFGCVQDLYAIAGANVEDLGNTERVAEGREARGQPPFRKREASDLVDTRMPI